MLQVNHQLHHQIQRVFDLLEKGNYQNPISFEYLRAIRRLTSDIYEIL